MKMILYCWKYLMKTRAEKSGDGYSFSKYKEKPQTTESHVEEGVVGDSVGDFQLPNFESIFNDTDDYKFDRHIAALIEMEDAKKLFNDCWNTKNDALKETPSATSQCHLDTKGKSKVVCGDETVSPKVKSKFGMDLDNFLIPKNKFRLHELSKNSHIAYRTPLNVSRKNECVVIDIMKPSENVGALWVCTLSVFCNV
ncbi:hypothetical protein Hdeb2414_s0001g00021461 [Helianthus debilis subsp. tardiflorus]